MPGRCIPEMFTCTWLSSAMFVGRMGISLLVSLPSSATTLNVTCWPSRCAMGLQKVNVAEANSLKAKPETTGRSHGILVSVEDVGAVGAPHGLHPLPPFDAEPSAPPTTTADDGVVPVSAPPAGGRVVEGAEVVYAGTRLKGKLAGYTTRSWATWATVSGATSQPPLPFVPKPSYSHVRQLPAKTSQMMGSSCPLLSKSRCE
mmetsp:Transcript_93125/g.299785  ORF Transcript_93125/g.299785 Transcript_93125/m.299785 type:complete len:202 (+) Transcript_93125:938-1543(+)